jgi:SAM-dependent methyltransferase
VALQLGPDRFGIATVVSRWGGKALVADRARKRGPVPDIVLADLGFLPGEMRDYFDIVASALAIEDLGSPALWARFVCEAAKCLRAGGLALFVGALSLNGDNDAMALTRLDLERLSLRLIASGLDVAQIRYGTGQVGSADTDGTMTACPLFIVISRAC